MDLDATKNYNNPSADHLRFSTLGGSDGSNNMMSSSDLCPTLIPDSAQYDNTFEVPTIFHFKNETKDCRQSYCYRIKINPLFFSRIYSVVSYSLP